MKNKKADLPPELTALLPTYLHAQCKRVSIDSGTIVFRAATAPKYIYFVSEGEIHLVRYSNDGQKIVLQRAINDFLAQASLTSSHYHCDAVAAGRVSAIKIPIAALKETIQKDPQFALAWISMLNQQVKQLRFQCERLTLRTVKERLFHYIITESKNGTIVTRDGLKPIAVQIGVSHEALYRCIAQLENNCVLTRTKDTVTLIEPRSRV
jgi:CRP/FNR family transcriptional regulator, dissimilatory nitrate respiration regulator